MNHKDAKRFLHQRKHKNKIVYPHLVEDMYQHCRDKGEKITKAEVFAVLVDSNLIDQHGNPTQWALDQGYIKEISPKEAFINQAKIDNPILREFSNDHFTVTDDGELAADRTVVTTLLNDVINNPKASKKEVQLARAVLEDAEERWPKD